MRYPIIEGFDYYRGVTGVTGDLNTRWNVALNTSDVVLATGLGGDGQCLSLGTSGVGGTVGQAFEASSKVTVHFAFRFNSLIAAASTPVLKFALAADGSQQYGIDFNFAGQLRFKDKTNAVLCTAETPFIVSQVYRCCATINIIDGDVGLSINGDVDAGFALDANAALQASAAPSLIQIGKQGSSTYSIDDLILGIDECVDWGPLEVNTMPANLDVACAWTRSVGADNYANVDDIPFTADTDYNSSVTVGQKDIFEYGNSPHVPSSILAVQLMTVARKEESAERKIREVMRISGVDYPGTEHNLAETYGAWTSTWDKNPETDAAWTAAALNAIQGGYELTVAA